MAELTFRGEDNTVYVKGSDVSKSQVAVDQQNRYVVELELRVRVQRNLQMRQRSLSDRLWGFTWMRS